LLVSQNIKKIYFLALCGTGMASLAAMMKQKGYTVYGSDKSVYPPMSDFLAEQKIPIYDGFEPAHLDPAPDLVVVGNVISRGNSELEYLLNEKIPYMSLPDVLREFFIRDHRSIVVTGTHGKTTTTSMLSWIYHVADLEPSFMVGGIPNNFEKSYQLGTGKDFIVEGDEYDSAYFDKVAKFMRYMPDIGVINTIEFDHADIYGSMDEIVTAFQRFVNLIPQNGLLIVCSDNEQAFKVSQRAFCPVITFGLESPADWTAENISVSATGMEFDVKQEGKFWEHVIMPMVGRHNIRNALAAVIVANYAAISKNDICYALSTFKGVKRRLEIKPAVNGIIIYDDFAHHPTAVYETLSALCDRHAGQKIYALYEPRSATSRRNVFQKEFVSAFQPADTVLIAPVHRPDKAPASRLFSGEKLAQELREKGKESHLMTVSQMIAYLKSNLHEGDIVVTFSNGPFDNIHEKLQETLKNLKIEKG